MLQAIRGRFPEAPIKKTYSSVAIEMWRPKSEAKTDMNQGGAMEKGRSANNHVGKMHRAAINEL